MSEMINDAPLHQRVRAAKKSLDAWREATTEEWRSPAVETSSGSVPYL